MKKKFVVVILLLTSSCVSYKPPIEGDVAYIRFSTGNTTLSIAELDTMKWNTLNSSYLAGFGNSTQIETISAERYSTFKMSYSFENVASISSCEVSLSYAFKPKKNTFYYIYTNTLNRKCEITVSEVLITEDDAIKWAKSGVEPEDYRIKDLLTIENSDIVDIPRN